LQVFGSCDLLVNIILLAIIFFCSRKNLSVFYFCGLQQLKERSHADQRERVFFLQMTLKQPRKGVCLLSCQILANIAQTTLDLL
jgi:hypothetical protein